MITFKEYDDRTDQYVADEIKKRKLAKHVVNATDDYRLKKTKAAMNFRHRNIHKGGDDDINEAYTEVHMDRKMRDKTHPNNLVGTTGHLKNVQDKVTGSSWGIQFINKYRKK